MNLLTVIGTGAAYIRYQRAKSDYEAIKEMREAAKAAVDAFNLERKHNAEDYQTDYKDPNSEIPGVSATTVIKIKSIGKSIISTSLYVNLSNNTDSTIVIRQAEASVYIHNDLLGFAKEQRKYIYSILPPNSLLTIELPGGKAAFSNNQKESNKKLKEDIVFAGKDNTEIVGIETADIRIKWKPKNGTSEYDALYQNKNGIVQYDKGLYQSDKKK